MSNQSNAPHDAGSSGSNLDHVSADFSLPPLNLCANAMEFAQGVRLAYSASVIMDAHLHSTSSIIRAAASPVMRGATGLLTPSEACDLTPGLQANS